MRAPALVLVPDARRDWAATPLAGETLLRRAVLTLEACPAVERVEVCSGDLAVALQAVATEVVVVHDPLHPLAPPVLVDAVLAALADDARAAGAVPVRPVVDTLKVVDPDGALAGTIDRSRYAMPGGPQAYRREALLGAVRRAGPGEGPELPDLLELPALVLSAGGVLRTVPSVVDDPRVVDEQSLRLAEGLLRSRSGRAR